jgi:hypothetical protein
MADEEDSKKSGEDEASDEKEAPEKEDAEKDEAADKPAVSSPWPSSRKSVAPPPADEVKPQLALKNSDEWPKQPWGEKLFVLDQKWTKLEARLLWWVLAAEIFLLCFVVLIGGLATDANGEAVSGIVLRSVLGALVIGGLTRRFTKGHQYQQAFVTAAVVVGCLLGPAWKNAGVAYFGNFRNWMQNASVLLLVGGVSSLAKRLTLWLALLGASIATAQGKHINVDVVMRFLGPKARVPVAVLGWLAASLVCFGGVRAFFDELAIADYRAKDEKPCADNPHNSCQTTEGERWSEMAVVMRRDFFILGRQASLDMRALPKVLGGTRYDDWFTAKEWNTWMKEGGWEAYYPKADVDSLQMPEDGDAKRSPAVIIPGAAENPQELMLRELDLIVPFGLLMIAIRFLLRAALALSGWIKVDPNAAHADDLGPNEEDREKHEEEDLKSAGGKA